MRNPVIRISDQFRYKSGYATKMAGGLKVRIYKVQELYAAKTKALISCAVTTQLICTFVLCIYKKQNFSWLDSTHNPQSRTQNEKKKYWVHFFFFFTICCCFNLLLYGFIGFYLLIYGINIIGVVVNNQYLEQSFIL